ncbi:hypothetical protein AAMO2058_000379000 [Amorphochlora amoebiformis]
MVSLNVHVLVVGAGGLGAEILQHIMLARPKSLTVYDNTKTTMEDVSSSFLLQPADVGIARSVATVPHLQISNHDVVVSAHIGNLSLEYLHNFDVIVMAGSHSRSELERVNSFCRHRRKIDEKGNVRSAPAVFIAADTRGPSGYVMSDFGTTFQTPPAPRLYFRSGVVGFEADSKRNVTIVKLHSRIPPGDLHRACFLFLGEGCERLFKAEKRLLLPVKGKKISPTSLEIPFALKDKEIKSYSGGLYICQYQEVLEARFKSLRKRWRAGVGLKDLSAQTQLGYQAVLEFESESGRKPKAGNTADANKVLSLAESLNERQRRIAPGRTGVGVIDKRVIHSLSTMSTVELPPMCSLLGAVAAGEVLKSRGGGGVPLESSFFHFPQVVPNTPSKSSSEEIKEKKFQEIYSYKNDNGGDKKVIDPAPQIVGKTGKAGETGLTGKAGETGLTEKTGKTGKPGETGETGGTEKKEEIEGVKSSSGEISTENLDKNSEKATISAYVVVALGETKVYSKASFDAERGPKGFKSGQIVEGTTSQKGWIRLLGTDYYLPLEDSLGAPIIRFLQHSSVDGKEKGLSLEPKSCTLNRLAELRVLVIGTGEPAFSILRLFASLGVATEESKGGVMVLANDEIDAAALPLHWWTRPAWRERGMSATRVLQRAIDSFPSSIHLVVQDLNEALKQKFDITILTLDETTPFSPFLARFISSEKFRNSAEKLISILRVEPGGLAASVEIVKGTPDVEESQGNLQTTVAGLWRGEYCPISTQECFESACRLASTLFSSGPACAQYWVDRLSTSRVQQDSAKKQAKIREISEVFSESSALLYATQVLERRARISKPTDCIVEAARIYREVFQRDIDIHKPKVMAVLGETAQTSPLEPKPSESKMEKPSEPKPSESKTIKSLEPKPSESKSENPSEPSESKTENPSEPNKTTRTQSSEPNQTAESGSSEVSPSEPKEVITSGASGEGIYVWEEGGETEVRVGGLVGGRTPWSLILALRIRKGYLSRAKPREWVLTLGQLDKGGVQLCLESGGLIAAGCWDGAKVYAKIETEGLHTISLVFNGDMLSLAVDGDSPIPKPRSGLDLKSDVLRICKAPAMTEASCGATPIHFRLYKKALSAEELRILHQVVISPSKRLIRPGVPLPTPNVEKDDSTLQFISSTASLLATIYNVTTPGAALPIDSASVSKILSGEKQVTVPARLPEPSVTQGLVTALGGRAGASGEEKIGDLKSLEAVIEAYLKRVEVAIRAIRGNPNPNPPVTTGESPGSLDEKKSKKSAEDSDKDSKKTVVTSRAVKIKFTAISPGFASTSGKIKRALGEVDAGAQRALRRFVAATTALRARVFGLPEPSPDMVMGALRGGRAGPRLGAAGAAGYLGMLVAGMETQGKENKIRRHFRFDSAGNIHQ